MGLSDWYLLTAAIFSGLYFFLITAYLLQWLTMPVFIRSKKPLNSTVSIIIPARNEEENILNCLADISKQEFPMNNLEVIVVDDYSEDKTVDLALSFFENSFLNGRVIRLKETNHKLPYKKGAITEAIKIAANDLIITTDADCRMGKAWVSAIVSYYESYHPKMIAGPISYFHGIGLLNKLQSLEFAGLMLATAAGFKMRLPIMANGANLCYEKQAFEEVSGYDKTPDTASGDDLFLLLKFKKRFQSDLHFLKSHEAIVYTHPMKTLRTFWMQRKRWVSKSKHFNDIHFIAIGTIVVGTNIILLAGIPLCTFTNAIDKTLFIFIFGAKFVVDFFFLFFATKFHNKQKLMLLFPVGAVLNLLNVSIFGLIGVRGKYNWKGRIH